MIRIPSFKEPKCYGDGNSVIIHRRAAKCAKNKNFSLAVDPRGISFAFHRAGRTAREKIRKPFRQLEE